MSVDASNTSVVMRSGAVIDLSRPDPQQINLADIALGLARQRRFLGQTRFPICVATHSEFVGRIATAIGGSPQAGFAARMHDAHEFATSDLVTPFVRSLAHDAEISAPATSNDARPFIGVIVKSSFDLIKVRVDVAIANRFDTPLPFGSEQGVLKRADQIALEIEGRAGFNNWPRKALDDLGLEPPTFSDLCKVAATLINTRRRQSDFEAAQAWLVGLARFSPNQCFAEALQRASETVHLWRIEEASLCRAEDLL